MNAVQPLVRADCPASAPARKLSICLINPRFEPSYWGFEYALPLYPGDKRSTMISGALPTLAALGGPLVSVQEQFFQDLCDVMFIGEAEATWPQFLGYFQVYHFPEYLQRRADICRKAGEGKWLPTLGYGLALLWSLLRALYRDGALTSVGWTYWKYFWMRNIKYRRDVIGFAQFMNRCVTHWHFYKFTREAISGRLRAYNSG